MKKIIAMLLGLMLLCCAVFTAAGAATEDTKAPAEGAEAAEVTETAETPAEGAELPYIESEDQDVYISATVLTEASYPQVCISPYSSYELFARNKKDPWYVTFPVPEGLRCESFSVDNANFLSLDANNAYEIYYQAADRYSYEDFLLDCEDKENNMLMDGSEKVAAYISPDSGRARALFGLDEIQEGAKLYVQIHVQHLNKKEDAEKAEILKKAISDEIARIQGSMKCVKMDKFWTDGAYKGVKLYNKSLPGNYLVMNMPEISFHFTEEGFGGQVFPVDVDGMDVKAYVCKDREKSVDISIDADTYSYVYYNRDESEITKVTLSDGNEWGIYVANEKDGQPYSVHAARVLTTTGSGDDEKPVYLTVQINASSSGLYWADVDAFAKDLDVIAQSVKTAE